MYTPIYSEIIHIYNPIYPDIIQPYMLLYSQISFILKCYCIWILSMHKCSFISRHPTHIYAYIYSYHTNV